MLLSLLWRHMSTKTSSTHLGSLCNTLNVKALYYWPFARGPPVTDGLQMVSKAKNVSISEYICMHHLFQILKRKKGWKWQFKTFYHDGVIKWKLFPRWCAFVGEYTGHWWIPLTKASDMELWCFLWSAPEQTVEQTLKTPRSLCRHCNVNLRYRECVRIILRTATSD